MHLEDLRQDLPHVLRIGVAELIQYLEALFEPDVLSGPAGPRVDSDRVLFVPLVDLFRIVDHDELLEVLGDHVHGLSQLPISADDTVLSIVPPRYVTAWVYLVQDLVRVLSR